ncbi:MAG: UPF0271 protein [Hyphomicrobiaceae bacterium]|jgi:UPF0271 protein
MVDINLNCDMAEGYGVYNIGSDDELIGVIGSANIACGFHGGDPGTMRRFVARARDAGVSIGAHPGFADLEGFGRRRIEMDPRDIEDMVIYQIGALQAIAHACGTRVSHVKPHGALANMAAEERVYADAVSRAVQCVGDDLIMVALAESEQHISSGLMGIRVAREGYADRLYLDDGNLAPRSLPGAVFHSAELAVAQALRMVFDGEVTTQSGSALPVGIDTICVHGDGPAAVAIAHALRAALIARGARITPLDAMDLQVSGYARPSLSA